WRVDCHVRRDVASAHDRRPRHFRPVLPLAELASGRDLVPPSLAARLPARKTAAGIPATEPSMTDHAFKSDFLKTLQSRGYIHQVTHPVELDEAASTGIVTAYIGFD